MLLYSVLMYNAPICNTTMGCAMPIPGRSQVVDVVLGWAQQRAFQTRNMGHAGLFQGNGTFVYNDSSGVGEERRVGTD
jgi:hypothetical protein